MDYIYKLLKKEKNSTLDAIKDCQDFELKAELIGNKNLIDYSIALLKKCEDFDIKPKSIFTKLPEQICQSPIGNFI